MKHAMLVAVALLALGAAAQAQDVQIKLGTLAPEGSPWHSIIRDMSEEWKTSLGGKLKFQIFAGGVAGDEPDMVRKMRVGQLHAAALTGVGLSEIAPEIMTLQLPMLIRNDEELDYVRDKLAPELEAILKKKGFIVVNWGEAGWVHFFAQTPVVSVADLRKVKLMVWTGNAGEVAAWKDVGANPVPLAVTDMHSGLKSGLINAFATTPLAALSFQWFGSAPEMSDMRWAPLIGATVVTDKQWNTVPEAARAALFQSGEKAGARFRTETRKCSEEAVDAMKKIHLTVHPAPPEAVAEWEKLSRQAWSKLMGKSFSPEMVSKIEKLLAEFRARKAEGK
jgi:TRAP-type C4-dicarboxylate transport system substrate-binding protein